MRILIAVEAYNHRANGAAKSVEINATALARRRNSVRVFYLTDLSNTPLESSTFIDGVEMRRVRFERMKYVLQREKYDLVITTGRIAPEVVKNANSAVIVEVREPYNVICNAKSVVCPDGEKKWRDWQNCSMGCASHNPILMAGSVFKRENVFLVANSMWTAGLISRFYGKIAAVINPPVDGEYVRSNGNTILFVGNELRKGLGTFAEIARLLPRRKFAVAGDASRLSVDWPKNVELMGHLPNTDIAYQRAKIVVCCDKEPPAFNRVPREAARFGVPSVASAVGGLPESVAGAGILVDRVNDPKAYVRAICKLDDRKTYQEMQNKAAMNHNASDTTAAYVELCERIAAKTF